MTEPAGAAGTVVDVTVTTASGTSGTSPADRYSFGGQTFAYVANYGSGSVTPITLSNNTAATPNHRRHRRLDHRRHLCARTRGRVHGGTGA
jgi:hypothetical protein